MAKSLETTEISVWKQKMCRKKLRFKARNVCLEAKRLDSYGRENMPVYSEKIIENGLQHCF
jgi:hypothetical protein